MSKEKVYDVEELIKSKELQGKLTELANDMDSEDRDVAIHAAKELLRLTNG